MAVHSVDWLALVMQSRPFHIIFGAALHSIFDEQVGEQVVTVQASWLKHEMGKTPELIFDLRIYTCLSIKSWVAMCPALQRRVICIEGLLEDTPLF